MNAICPACGSVSIAFLWICILVGFGVKRKIRVTAYTALVATAVIVPLFFYYERPKAVFEREFGFPPLPDVTAIQSSELALGDSSTAYLRFTASPSTIQRLVTAKGLTPLTPGCAPPTEGSNQPKWWHVSRDRVREYLLRSKEHFAFEETYVAYDPLSGQAFYRFLGID